VIRLVLASSSPARASLLKAAGIDADILIPTADEAALSKQLRQQDANLSAKDLVAALAKAKAESVLDNPASHGALVLGGDSALAFQGEILGKPHDPAVAIQRWQSLRGNSGELFSGHYLIDNRDPKNPKGLSGVSSTKVYFAMLSDQEVLDYVATGEPLLVAGAFTIDGLGGAFIEKIEGDAHTVVGLSLRVLRQLSGELGVHYPSLWR
jgi:septum formation protein